MPPRPRPLNPSVPVERFALALRRLHRDAGRPKQQVLAAAMHCSHATVSAILNGHRFPSWEQTAAFVRACRGDVQVWRPRWVDVDREISAELSPDHGEEALLRASSSPVQQLTGRHHYKALTAQIRETQSRILTTYIRVTPPLYFVGFTDRDTGDAAEEYFAELGNWLLVEGARSMCRLICLPNREMIEWAREHHERSRDLPNYEVRVVDWQINADPVNLAVFDDTTAFLTFAAGTAQEMTGFRIDDRNLVRDATGYFGRLWSSGIPLADRLAEL
ncbi:helix-turn-helix domain-containing protein [Actinomadura sp. 9N215]|uniref:helix-turn-helix domain-containing protein n=1 Tax=Actinomadura sp. 9N215 TaxID=3375150 RepID=UPI0037BACA4B